MLKVNFARDTFGYIQNHNHDRFQRSRAKLWRELEACEKRGKQSSLRVTYWPMNLKVAYCLHTKTSTCIRHLSVEITLHTSLHIFQIRCAMRSTSVPIHLIPFCHRVSWSATLSFHFPAIQFLESMLLQLKWQEPEIWKKFRNSLQCLRKLWIVSSVGPSHGSRHSESNSPLLASTPFLDGIQ